MCLKYQERTEKMKVNFKKICVPFQVVFVHTPPDQSTVELKLSLQHFRHLFQTETKGTFLLTLKFLSVICLGMWCKVPIKILNCKKKVFFLPWQKI